VSDLRFALLSGSTRTGSQSGKVARFAAARLTARHAGAQVDVIDLATTPVESWHEGLWNGQPASPVWQATSATLAAADALVVVSPEWNGMAPPALMNVFLMASKGELAHKPALLVAVSAAVGGAYVIAELRVSGAKNTQVVYIPEHVVIRDVKNVLNGPDPASEADERVRARLDYGLGLLGAYGVALRGVRGSGLIDRKTFPNGM
jgi:NAD(P)H-dependent FMN reductase